MSLVLRKCTIDDIDIIYSISNDPEVRANSINNNLILYKDHCKWFIDSLHNHDRIMYLIEDDNNIVGQIRLDKQNYKGIISYSIEKNNRNKGFGSRVLNIIKFEAKKNNILIIEGVVKKNNIASIKAFRKNGFIEFDEKEFFRYTYILREEDSIEFN